MWVGQVSSNFRTIRTAVDGYVMERMEGDGKRTRNDRESEVITDDYQVIHT